LRAVNPPTHPSKLTLPAFWISEPAAWFALAEAKFRTSNITSQRVMFDLLVAALPEMNLSQVMDIIKNIPVINPFEVLKLRLLEAHVLSDQEKMDALFQLGPLGDRKPSQLLASMLSVCPSGMELHVQPVFQYLFLQRLPQTLRTLLSKQECRDIRALVALADRLWASHKPQPQEVMAVQEPVSSCDGEQQIAVVQPKKRHPKKKTGGGGGPSGNGGVLSHAEQAWVGSGLCFKNFVYGAKPTAAPSPATGRETRAPGAAKRRAPGLLVYINDQLSGQRFLVDTGAAFSILPHHSSEPATGQGQLGRVGPPSGAEASLQ
jgi:hypothetical protein